MSDPNEHSHIDSVGTYVKILVALLIATGVTTAVSRLDLGPFNTIVALSIASAKMLLVALFFMHVRHSTGLTKLVLMAAFLWLAILILITLSDFHTRGWLGTLGR